MSLSKVIFMTGILVSGNFAFAGDPVWDANFSDVEPSEIKQKNLKSIPSHIRLGKKALLYYF